MLRQQQKARFESPETGFYIFFVSISQMSRLLVTSSICMGQRIVGLTREGHTLAPISPKKIGARLRPSRVRHRRVRSTQTQKRSFKKKFDGIMRIGLYHH